MSVSFDAPAAPAAGYDIGIGQCASIDESIVAVRLDSAMVGRLLPAEPWHRFGSTLLWLAYDQCSTRRPPTVGSEVYLDSAALDSVGHASLDIGNTGTRVDIDLSALIRDTHPVIAPPAPTRTADAAARHKPLPALPAAPRSRGRPRSR